MSYLNRLPKELRLLLNRYTHRGNWELFDRTLQCINFRACRAERRSFNGLLEKLGLGSSMISKKLCVHTEDLITDEILMKVIQERVRMEAFGSHGVVDMIVASHDILKKHGSLLRIVPEYDGKSYTVEAAYVKP